MHKTPFIFFIAILIFIACKPSDQRENKESHKNSKTTKSIALAIHGGAGTIKRGNMDAKTEAEYRVKLLEALDAGFAVLEQGGPALEAVMASVKIMEDSPLFNAGKGARCSPMKARMKWMLPSWTGPRKTPGRLPP